MVDAPAEKDGDIPGKEAAQNQLGPTQTEEKSKKKRNRKKKNPRDTRDATEAVTPGTESVTNGDRNLTMASDVTKVPVVSKPQKAIQAKAATDKQAETAETEATTGDSAKRQRKRARARAANAGMGRDHDVKNPLNQTSVNAEVPNKSNSTTGSSKKRSREDETTDSQPAAKKARKVSFSEGVDKTAPSKIKEPYQNGLGTFTANGEATKKERRRSLDALQATESIASKDDKLPLAEVGEQGINGIADESKPMVRVRGGKSKRKSSLESKSISLEGNDPHL